jgi:propionyl-CoA carboxylase alpha chain
VVAGSVVPPFYDSMIAKVVAHGPTRAAAVRALRHALAGARIHGVATNRDQLVNVLDHPEFAAGRLHTGFLDEFPCREPRTGDPAVAAAALWHALDAWAARSPAIPGVAAGWRNNPAVERRRTVRSGGIELVVIESELVGRLARPVTIGADGEAEVVIEHGGVEVPYSVSPVDGGYALDGPDAHLMMSVTARHAVPGSDRPAGSLAAPLPGAVRRVLVATGDVVTAGQTVVVVEAMKMEHEIRAPAHGTVAAILVAVGDQVTTGQPLLTLADEITSARGGVSTGPV